MAAVPAVSLRAGPEHANKAETNMTPPMVRRSLAGRLLDWLFFPVRALFIPEHSRWCLSSLRDQRMRKVAEVAAGDTLDVGCGPGSVFTKYFHAHSVGIDVHGYPGVEMVVPDMTRLPFEDGRFDTLVLIAVGGHIPKRVRKAQFREFARVLKPGGRLVMTEGEPITQTISHVYRSWVGRITGRKGMDDERGMEEEEEYCMPFVELMGYLNTPPFRCVGHRRFMWRLNNLYIARREPS